MIATVRKEISASRVTREALGRRGEPSGLMAALAGLLDISLRYAHAVADPVTWVQHDARALRKTGYDLGQTVVAMADLDQSRTRFPSDLGEYGPIIADPEQRPDRYGQDIRSLPDYDVHNHAIVVPELLPSLRWSDEINDGANTLFLNS